MLNCSSKIQAFISSSSDENLFLHLVARSLVGKRDPTRSPEMNTSKEAEARCNQRWFLTTDSTTDNNDDAIPLPPVQDRPYKQIHGVERRRQWEGQDDMGMGGVGVEDGVAHDTSMLSPLPDEPPPHTEQQAEGKQRTIDTPPPIQSAGHSGRSRKQVERRGAERVYTIVDRLSIYLASDDLSRRTTRTDPSSPAGMGFSTFVSLTNSDAFALCVSLS
ncbi:hypothetical protein C8R45DRAFT_929769 [Mycena sanguinolenta]|nr:hypothetical protein C8R45DRAFT_929769 [Mycena sanguinolenta]